MFHKSKVPDRQILQKVTTQLPARGIRPPCNVRVNVRDGTVTLSGTIEFEMQRKAAIHAATNVNGVLRVVDNLAVMRNTIGGWHAKAAGMQLKHVRTQPQVEPASQEPAETEPSSDESATTESTPASSEPTPKRPVRPLYPKYDD